MSFTGFFISYPWRNSFSIIALCVFLHSQAHAMQASTNTLSLELNYPDVEDTLPKTMLNLFTAFTDITHLSLELKESASCPVNIMSTEAIADAQRQVPNPSNLHILLIYSDRSKVRTEAIAGVLLGTIHLTSLNIQIKDLDMNDEAIEALATTLSYYTRLTRLQLYLSGNNIGQKTVPSRIVDALLSLPIIDLSLDLSSNHISARGAIFSKIGKIKSLRRLYLNLSSNNILHLEEKYLQQFLESATCLTHFYLYLQENPMSPIAAETVVNTLKQLPALMVFVYRTPYYDPIKWNQTQNIVDNWCDHQT